MQKRKAGKTATIFLFSGTLTPMNTLTAILRLFLTQNAPEHCGCYKPKGNDPMPNLEKLKYFLHKNGEVYGENAIVKNSYCLEEGYLSPQCHYIEGDRVGPDDYRKQNDNELLGV